MYLKMLLLLPYAGFFLYEWILMVSQSLDRWIVEQDAGLHAWRV